MRAYMENRIKETGDNEDKIHKADFLEDYKAYYEIFLSILWEMLKGV